MAVKRHADPDPKFMAETRKQWPTPEPAMDNGPH